MKILHVANLGVGGAGIAALHLHKALLKSGIESCMMIRRKFGDEPHIDELKPQFFVRLRGWLGVKITNSLGVRGGSLNILPTGLHKVINSSDADVVHLHWVNNEMISIREIAKIQKPLVWTLHDCWPLLGAEHHSDADYWKIGHKKHESGQEGSLVTSNQQPATRAKLYLAVNQWTFKRKLKAWKNLKVHFIAPSHWMAEQVKHSKLFSDVPVTVIPNGLDLNVFKPMDQEVCRGKWNLPLDKKLILFGAHDPEEPNKGLDLLEGSLNSLPLDLRKDIEVVIFGADGHSGIAGLPTHWLGHIGATEKMAQLYSAVDAICVPSRKETYGLVAAEGIACGVPVVAFKTTGLIDVVAHKKTGWLADAFDFEDFAGGILWAFKNDRKDAQLDIGKRVPEQHVELYEQISLA